MTRNNINKNDIVHNIKNRYRLPSNYIESIYDNIVDLNYEILVVDNNSEDNSVKNIRLFFWI